MDITGYLSLPLGEWQYEISSLKGLKTIILRASKWNSFIPWYFYHLKPHNISFLLLPYFFRFFSRGSLTWILEHFLCRQLFLHACPIILCSFWEIGVLLDTFKIWLQFENKLIAIHSEQYRVFRSIHTQLNYIKLNWTCIQIIMVYFQ